MSTAGGFSVDLGDGDPLEVLGWDTLEGLAPDQNAREFQKQVDHASMYRQCFSSPAGRYVLNDFIELFFKQDIVHGEDPPGSPLPGIRQGQAHVVKRIFYMIEFANTGGGKLTGSGVLSEE